MTGIHHHHALGAGYQLHWYRIESVLGQGGFGITYLATDTNLNQPVAIKEFLPSDLAVRTQDSAVHPVSNDRSETFGWGLSRFLSEARTLALFRHPNIVRVYSVFEANGTAYMVMEYEQGTSLEDALKFRRLEGELALVSVIHALIDGLELVHEAGFVHRDIKPDNIFMRSNDGVPVLLDFGSARQAVGVAAKTLTSLVTPGYAPFEQYNSTRDNDRQGPWTDVYSLAATLYRGITGKGPIDALARADALLSGDQDPLIPLLSMAPAGFSPALLEAVDAGLAFQPQHRPQSLAEWRALLPARPTRPGFAAAAEHAPAVTQVSGDAATVVRGPAPSPGTASRTATVPGPTTPADGALAPGRGGSAARRTALAALVMVLLAAGGWAAWSLRPGQEGPAAPADSATAGAPDSATAPTPAPARVAPPPAKVGREAAQLANQRDRLEAERRALAQERAKLALGEEKRRTEQARRAAEEARTAEEARAAKAAAEARAAEEARAAKAAAEAQAAEEARAAKAAAEARAAEEARAAKVAAEAQAAEEARAAKAAAEAQAAEEARAAKAAAEAQAAEEARAAAEGRDVELRGLLEAASADVAALRLTSPPGRNAFERYRAVLDMDPDNAEARAGLERIVSRYLALAEDAAGKGDFARGAAMLDRAARVDPDAPRTAAARDALASRRAEAESRVAERSAREEAEARAREEVEARAREEARARAAEKAAAATRSPARAPVETVTRDVRWKEAEGTGCLVWNERPRKQETVSWNGACVDGKASGNGELTWKYVVSGKTLEQRYTGSMRNGKLHGQGILVAANGSRYEGAFRDDVKHGQGVYTASNGARYTGEWRSNKRTGRGVQAWPDGGRYDGEWRDNRLHGQGALTFANGGQYEGEFSNDKKHGHGVLTWRSGARYEGGWRDDKRSGRGVSTRPNGDRYEGEWAAGSPDGAGEAIIGGIRHSGHWSNGCMRDGGKPARWGKSLSECGF